ncbi:hypothetical protein [Pollutibacter soli]|uniref:gliding motility lipoprotein GldB n=1 Tax=Pollutibacter soli TaxID=3034157 RepID=UPI0030132EB8
MKYSLLLILIISLFACKTKSKGPDVSGIPIQLTVQRFEKDFFNLDTADLPGGLTELSKKYPRFTSDFLGQILGINPAEMQLMGFTAIKQFLHDYRTVKDEADKAVPDFTKYEKQVKSGLQYLKYYFPEYKAPDRIITFVGPMDAYAEGETGGYGDIITTDALGVGLQLHLGANSGFYTSEIGQRLYPSYISRRFAPDYIPVNCMKNIIDDLYPGSPNDRTLLEMMVDKGKRLYLLDRFLPESPDTLKIGYDAAQLSGAINNEGLIWNFFIQNNLLYETDVQKIKSYVGDGPKTNELGDGSPGYISLFIGRQIVRAYMEQFPETTLPQLLSVDAKKMLTGSKYKPR